MSQTIQPPSPGSITVASGAAGVFATSFGYYPAEGSRVVPAQYNWTATTGYAEDLSQLTARGVETTIQGMYVDNSNTSQVVTIQVLGTDQVIQVPANAQGVFPLYFTGAPGLQISVPAMAATVTRIAYLNMPPGGPSVWGASSSSSSGVVAQGTAPAGVSGNFNLATAQNTPPTYTDNTIQPMTQTDGGALRVMLSNAAGTTMAYADGIGYPNYSTTISGVYVTAPNEITVNSTVHPLIVDAYSSLFVDTECNSPTYSCATAITPAANATDVFTLYGSATKTIRIHQVAVVLDAGQGANDVKISFIKRSAVNSGYTATAPSIVPHDSNSAAATATPLNYSANATTLGTAVGFIEQYFLGAPANSGTPAYVYNYGASVGDQSIVLRGVTQGFAINLEGAALLSGEVVRVKIKWSEI